MPKSKRPRKQKKTPYPTKSAATATTQRPVIIQNSKILSLPKELLTHILTFTLIEPHPILLHSSQSRRWRNETESLVVRHYHHNSRRQIGCAEGAYLRYITKSRTLNILLVSKAFYFSGIEAFYNNNILQFTSVKKLSSFLAHINIDRRKCIQNISIAQTWASQAHSWVAVSDWAVNKIGAEEDFDPEILKKLPKLKVVKVVANLRNEWFYDKPTTEQQKLVGKKIEEKVRERWKEGVGEMLEFEMKIGAQP